MTQASDDQIMVVIAARSDPVDDIAVVELAAADGAPLPEYTPGAHIDVHVTDSIVRQYSLCTTPGSTGRYRIAVLNDPASRGGSRRIHDSFQVGRIVGIGRARNHFPLHEGDGKALLLGGGIGITPMLAMAYALDRSSRPFELNYCVRCRARAGFVTEIETAFPGRNQIHADEEMGGQFLDIPELLARQPEETHLYVCGPGGFMDAAIAAAREAGWPESRIHFEYFSAEVETGGESFEVIAKRSGLTVTVASDDTILSALTRAGITIKKSCEQGVCGTCLCDVIEGDIDHRDKFLTEDERADGDQIVTCCSRAKGNRLVLDI